MSARTAYLRQIAQMQTGLRTSLTGPAARYQALGDSKLTSDIQRQRSNIALRRASLAKQGQSLAVQAPPKSKPFTPPKPAQPSKPAALPQLSKLPKLVVQNFQTKPAKPKPAFTQTKPKTLAQATQNSKRYFQPQLDQQQKAYSIPKPKVRRLGATTSTPSQPKDPVVVEKTQAIVQSPSEYQ